MIKNASVLTLFAAFILFDAQSACAHVDHGQATGFATGLKHPWSGLDHIVAMLSRWRVGCPIGSAGDLVVADCLSDGDVPGCILRTNQAPRAGG